MISNIKDELSKANVNILEYEEEQIDVDITYNSFHLEDYKAYLTDIYTTTVIVIENSLPDDEDIRFEFLESLIDELEAYKTYFILNPNLFNHVKLNIAFLDIEGVKFHNEVHEIFKNQISIFISFQYLLYKKTLKYLVKLKRKYFGTEVLIPEPFEKIVWKGSPSQFGYLFLELVKKGFIELPKTRGIYSNTQFAKTCYTVFNIDTTLGTLIKALNPKDNKLTDANRKAFVIPDIKTLS